MKKILSSFGLLCMSFAFTACKANPTTVEETEQPSVEDSTEAETVEESTITLDQFGKKVTFTPSKEDWCGDNCVIYPEDGVMYIRNTDRGDDTFYPEGTDNISQEASDEITEIIQNLVELHVYGADNENTVFFSPSKEDWCGDNCVIYPEDGVMYIRNTDRGDDTFYPEGTDNISQEASDEITEIIRNDQ